MKRHPIHTTHKIFLILFHIVSISDMKGLPMHILWGTFLIISFESDLVWFYLSDLFLDIKKDVNSFNLIMFQNFSDYFSSIQ